MVLSKLEQVINKSQPWLRLAVVIDNPIRESLLHVLHKDGPYHVDVYTALPRNPVDLYAAISTPCNIAKINKLKQSNLLKPDQLKLLFPSDGKPDSSKFDCTLIVLLIKNFTDLKTMNGKLNVNNLIANDKSILSFVIRALALRNEILHFGYIIGMTASQNSNFWKKIENILNGLRYNKDLTQFKSVSLDPGCQNTYKLFFQALVCQCDHLQREHENLIGQFDKFREEHDDLLYAHEHLAIAFYTDACEKSKRIKDVESALSTLKTMCGYLHNKTSQDTVLGVIQFITNMRDYVEEPQDLLVPKKNVENPGHKIIGDYGLKLPNQITEMVCSKIGKDWKNLSQSLQLQNSVFSRFQSAKNNMEYCLKQKEFTWHEMRLALTEISRDDIVQDICMAFDYPTGMEHFKHYKKDYVIHSHESVEISNAVELNGLQELNASTTITFISHGNTSSTISLRDWDERCTKYVKRYFTKQMRLIVPPPKKLKSKLVSIAKKIIDCFELGHKPVYMFLNYDLLKHARFYVGSLGKYQTLLHSLSIGEYATQKGFDKRMLLVNSNLNVVLNIRISMGDNISLVLDEEKKGRSDLKVLLYLNKRFIKESQTRFINVIVAPHVVIDTDESVCKSCCIIDKKILNASLEEWIRCNIYQYQTELNSVGLSNFGGIIRSVFGFYGTLHFNSNEFNCFPRLVPSLSKAGFEHKEIINLFLTYQQANIVHHPSLKKIVFGGFGAGKSVIGHCVLNELARDEERNDDYTFYIVWDDRSLFHLVIKEIVAKIRDQSPNKHIYGFSCMQLAQEYLKLPKFPRISKLLQAVKDKCNGTVNFIIDEYDMEDLDDNESHNLSLLFKMEDWKDSVVLILPQSLEKDRKIVLTGNVVSPNTSKSYHGIGLSIFTLKQHMRSTTSNFNFTKMSTDVVSKEVKNAIPLPSQEISQLHSDFTATGNHHVMHTETDQDIVHFEKGMPLEKATLADERNKVLPGSSKDLQSKPSVQEFQVPVEVDELLSNIVFSNSSHQNETTYSCRECLDVGHEIVGSEPVFLFFEKEPTSLMECIVSLCIALKTLCFDKLCERLLLCKSTETGLFLMNVLNIMERNYQMCHRLSDYKLKDDKGVPLDKLPANYTAIMDNRSCKGLECEQVVVLIEPGMINQQQIFLDMISRSTTQLFLVFLHPFQTFDRGLMPPVIHKILVSAIEKQYIQKLQIQVYEEDNCDITSKQEDVDHSLTKFMINRISCEFTRLLEASGKNLVVDTTEEMQVKSPYDRPTGLQTIYHKETSGCLLRWENSPYDYIVKMKKKLSDDWEYISEPIQNSEFIFRDLLQEEEYLFSVITISCLGESIPCEISWTHIDMFQLIEDENLERFCEILRRIPMRVKDTNENRSSLCHWAAYLGRVLFLKQILLLEPKLIHKRDVWGYTPLHHAWCFGHLEAGKFLLSNNADPNAVDIYGRSVFLMAGKLVSGKEQEIKTVFKKYAKNCSFK